MWTPTVNESAELTQLGDLKVNSLLWGTGTVCLSTDRAKTFLPFTYLTIIIIYLKHLLISVSVCVVCICPWVQQCYICNTPELGIKFLICMRRYLRAMLDMTPNFTLKNFISNWKFLNIKYLPEQGNLKHPFFFAMFKTWTTLLIFHTSICKLRKSQKSSNSLNNSL